MAEGGSKRAIAPSGLQPCYSPARNRALRSTELARRLVTPGQVSPHVRQIVGGAARRYTTSSQWQPPTYEPVNAFPKVFRVITGEPMVRGEKYGYYSVALDSTLMSDWLWEWAKFISYLLRTVSKAAGLGAFCGCFEGRPPVLPRRGVGAIPDPFRVNSTPEHRDGGGVPTLFAGPRWRLPFSLSYSNLQPYFDLPYPSWCSLT
ncbi:hypothetical protein FA13DRAFT_1712695 [Coprinellus micaceus]|uniref:Uncharacterized protein n=1 Tax=Coprinellus micaceus TaxID=71717 RepID=A0A4Y7T1C5_COPMI|nr:hypothetical protein FA13DRAFT_1712695 [Coprinellus micaceus]